MLRRILAQYPLGGFVMPLALHLFPIAESLTPSSFASSTEGLPHTSSLSSSSVGHTILLVRRSGLFSIRTLLTAGTSQVRFFMVSVKGL
mgnify:CR=1 FL=1